MKLWTTQTLEVYNHLIKTGIHHCDETKIDDFEVWEIAYDWLSAQMSKRIGKSPIGVKYPVWFWYKWNGQNKKPDLRARRSFGTKGQKMVILEAEIPEDKVLLSDFDSWHFVLNNSHTYFSACNEYEYNKLDKWLNSLSEEERHKEIIKSWDSIFDITPYKNDFCRNGYFIQGTAWELKAENIVKATPFTC